MTVEVGSEIGGLRRDDNRGVRGKKKKTRAKPEDPLAAYRRIRKPMPPPEKVFEDKRRKLEEDDARRQIEGGR